MSGAGLAAYRTLSPLMPGVLRLLSPLIAPLKEFLRLRQSLFSDIERKLTAIPKPACRLWVHASSVGEFEQARPVIAELKRKMPGLDVVVSFLSDSGYEARKNYENASAVFYLPIDTPANARRIVGMIKPDIFMLMRYDFWPNHLETIKRSGAKMVLASAALPPGSSCFHPLLKGFHRDIFALFDSIFTVSEEDRKTFIETFGCRNVIQAGDPRFDQVEQRRRDSDARATSLKPWFEGLQVLVAGSTWKEDESALLPAWIPFRDKLSLVVVPHKVDRPNIERLLLDLRQRGLEAVTISLMGDRFDPGKQVLVVDQTGYLAELYTVASMAYVGGAFGVNVHNTIEPAVHGIPVLFGPNYSKSPEAMGLIESGGATTISGEPDLRHALARFVEDPAFLRQAGERAGTFVNSRLGATRIVSDAMEGMCRTRSRSSI
jgi:3-deoxy-D-manno-octulosonic-acid transferase